VQRAARAQLVVPGSSAVLFRSRRWLTQSLTAAGTGAPAARPWIPVASAIPPDIAHAADRCTGRGELPAALHESEARGELLPPDIAVRDAGRHLVLLPSLHAMSGGIAAWDAPRR
jgi:hypothetical protein